MNSIYMPLRTLAFILAIIFMFGFGVQFTVAQDDADASRPDQATIEERKGAAREALEARQDEVTQAQEERREGLENKREEREAAMDEARKDRILKYTDRIVERMLNAVVRLRNIADKIANRIIKLEEKFVDRELDLSVASEHLDIARGLLTDAETSIGELPASVEEALESGTPKEAFEAARSLFASAKDDIKAAHTALKDAIVNVKVGVAPLSEADEESAEDENDEEDNTTDDDGDDTDEDTSE